MLKRIISILLCVVMLCSILPAGVFAEEGTYILLYDYERQVARNFDNSFKESDYFRELTTHNHYYMQWASNIKNLDIYQYAITQATDHLLKNELTKDDYVKYLMNLMSMLEADFADSVVAQAEFKVKQNLGMISGELLMTALFMDDDIKKQYSEVYSLVKKWLDFSEKVIKDTTQLAAMALECSSYENRLTVLNAIKDNASDQNLKSAADELIQMYTYQLMYFVDQYSEIILEKEREVLKKAIDESIECFDLNEPFKKIKGYVLRETNSAFVLWLREKFGSEMSEKILGQIAKCVAVKNLLPYVTIGLEIGSAFMKIWVGDQAELFKEMRATVEIRQALVKAFEASRFYAKSGDYETRYAKIEQYVAIGRALVYTHLRGEYCDIQSRSEKERAELETKYYDAKFVPQLMEYYDILERILSEAEFAKRADDVKNDETQYIVRAKPEGSDRWGYVDIRTGEMVIPAKYSKASAEFNRQGTAIVYDQDEDCALINMEGEYIFLFGEIDSAQTYYEGEYTVVQKDKTHCYLYKGMEECFEFEIPMENLKSVVPTGARYYHYLGTLGREAFYIPERFIPLIASDNAGNYLVYWFDETGKLICSSDTHSCGLAHDEFGYYFYTGSHLQFLDKEGNLIKEQYNPYIPQVDYDGDKWYVNHDNRIMTNGFVEIESDMPLGSMHAWGFPMDVNDGILISGNVVFTADGWFLFQDLNYNGLAYRNGYMRTNTKGFCDQNGNTLCAYEEGTNGNDYSTVYPDGYYIYRSKNGLCGIKNVDGTIVCEAIYEALGELD